MRDTKHGATIAIEFGEDGKAMPLIQVYRHFFGDIIKVSEQKKHVFKR